ncbi:MAG: SDR family oxidoreductase [Bacteroidota bacterium]
MSGRVVWITGGGTGIGCALAERFHETGWSVAVSSRKGVRLRQWARRRDRTLIVTCNVRRESSVQRAYRQVVKKLGAPEIVVNSAGVTAFKGLTETTVGEYRSIIDTNLTGLFLVARAVVPAMQRRRSGTIVNILSYAAKAVYTKSSIYSASKAGADAMMRVLREEVRADGVRILNVFPGAVETPMWPEHLRQKYAGVMMSAPHVAMAIHHVATLPSDIMPEEFVIRPQIGDLRI